MLKQIWNKYGSQMTQAAIANQAPGSRLNLKLGIALLRDRRVPIGSKLLSLGLGGGLLALLLALEIAPEGVLAALLPALGLAVDVIADGLEAIIVPFLFSGLMLPFLAPRPIVDEIMAERAAKDAPQALPPN